MSDDRLVSVRSLVCAFRSIAMAHATEAMNAEGTAKGVLNEYLFNIENNIADLLENGDLGVTVDAVPREEHELLVRRLEHLLESDYIRSFDEKDIMTGKYKRDIRDADRENHSGRWINESHGYRNCSECGCEHPILDANGFHLDDRYCPDCGAKMKEVSR